MLRRPAVSRITTSRTWRLAASTPWRAMSGTLVPSGARKTGMSSCLPSVSSWSAAAGRYGSAATSNGRRPCLTMWRASLAVLVVLPEPCRPTIATTAGLPERWNTRSPVPRRSTSSSWTILTTCWPAVRLARTSPPMAFSRTRATKSFTTLKLTSASSSASRTSRMAVSTSASLIRPRPVRLPSVARSRSLRVSNTARSGLPWLVRAGWVATGGHGRSGGARVLTHRGVECSAGSRETRRRTNPQGQPM